MNMNKRMLIVAIMTGLAASSVHAEEAHHPENADESAGTQVTQDISTSSDTKASTSDGSPVPMMGRGMMGDMHKGQGMMAHMHGQDRNAGMQGHRGQGMMAHMHGQDRDAEMQGHRGQGMMGGRHKGQGMMVHMHGQDTHRGMAKQSGVGSRLDLIEARLAKIEILLERLNQR